MTTQATAVRERPIPFSGEMVKAIFAGRKSQTRRVIKPQPSWDNYSPVKKIVAERMGYIGWWKSGGVSAADLIPYCPYGGIGNRLWVRETYLLRNAGRSIVFKADMDPVEAAGFGALYGGWKSWTPRRFSRLTLEITDVRVQRVQEISDADVIAEGIEQRHIEKLRPFFHRNDIHALAFAETWQAINGKRPGCAWKDSPWVWALTFRVVTAPGAGAGEKVEAGNG